MLLIKKLVICYSYPDNLPISSDGKMIKGKIGKDLNLEDGQKASKLCVLNILAQVKKALNGDLDKLKNCIKITGYVNSSDDFTDQPKGNKSRLRNFVYVFLVIMGNMQELQ